MRYRIIAFEKPSLGYAKEGIQTYRTRMQRFAQVEEIYLKAGKSCLSASEKTYRIALDERGTSLSTQAWAKHIQNLENQAISTISFLIGAADGHADQVREQADECWQLGAMTMNHELALVVLWEQIYRVHALLNGHPYHRA